MMASKTSHCTTVCLLLSVLALGITTFLLAYTLKDQIGNDQPAMVTRPVNPEDLPYPPMKLCYSHWSAWMNFTAAYQMNFTKAEVYYAASYLTQHIYSVERFDVKETSESFIGKLKANGLTMTQFFLKTARKFDNIIFGHDSSVPVEHTTTLEPLQLYMPLFNQYYVLCYTFSDDTVADMVASLRDRLENEADIFVSEAEKHTGITINPSEFDLEYGQKEIHEIEKVRNLEHLSGIISNLKSLPGSERFPALVYINAYRPDPLVANILGSVHVTLKASGFVKSPTAGNCVQDKPQFVDDRSCYDKCIWKFDMDRYHYNDSPPNGAHFHFLAADNGTTAFEKPQSFPRYLPESQSMFNFYQKGDFECTKKCQQEIGCISWSYDINVERTAFGGPVQIRYPIPEQTMVMEKVEPIAWNNVPCYMIGLLSLWFCVVALSMIQLICMCMQADACCGWKKSTSMEVLVKE